MIQYGLRKKFSGVLVRWLERGPMRNAESLAIPAFRKCAFSTSAGMHDLFNAAIMLRKRGAT